MASGRPDWYQTVVIQGKHLETFVPVGVDGEGNMVAVISSGNIDVGTITSMIDKDRDVRGLSGVNKLPIAVDATGHMLSRMQGIFGAALKDIKVDTNGNMIAVIKGDFAGALKTIAVDTNGIMKANLVVQDLARLIMRTSYGPIIEGDLGHIFGGIEQTDILDVTGAGTILGGFLLHSTGASHKQCSVRMSIDGVDFTTRKFETMMAYNCTEMYALPTKILEYNDYTFRYIIGFVYGWSFDTGFKVRFSEAVGASTTVGAIYYSLIV